MKARGKVAKQESDHKRDADRRPAASILLRNYSKRPDFHDIARLK